MDLDEYPMSDEIRNINQKLNKLATKREEIKYLEKLLFDDTITDVVYGVEGLEDNTKTFVNSYLEYLYKGMKLEEGMEPQIKLKKIGKKPDNGFNHSQQMLLLEKLGIIKYLDKYKLTGENKALLISKFIGKDYQNTRTFLIYMDKTAHKKAVIQRRTMS